MKCAIGVGILGAALLLACSDEREPIPDAGTAEDAAVDRAADRASDAAVADVSIDTPRSDGFIDLFDVIPLPDGGCPGCIRDRCSTQINNCINNPACAAGLFCTLQMCAGGLAGEGGFNPSAFVCVLGCFNGDQSLAIMAISSLTCVTMTCGAACNFIDAGSDVRSQPDVLAPDVSADTAMPDDVNVDTTPPDDVNVDTTPPEDATPDTVMPDAGPSSDAADDTDAGSPSDAAAEVPPSDASSEVDGGSSDDATDATTPDDGG